MGCCSNDEPDWKKEQTNEYKFDYVNVEDFVTKSIWLRFTYLMVYLSTLKSILVYMADIGSILLLVISGAFDGLLRNDEEAIRKACSTCDVTSTDPNSPKYSGQQNESDFEWLTPKARLGLTFASILISFIMLAFEWRKSVRIIKSRDISLSMTSQTASRYYSIRSYAHHCFFEKIRDSRKTTDILAFYVYFAFRGWARLIFAEGLRQIIYLINIVDIFKNRFPGLPLTRRVELIWETTDNTALVSLGFMMVSSIIWLFSIAQIFFAFLIYLNLIFKIQGNLKEYCVHKIDKRLGQLFAKQSRKKREEARKAELMQMERQRLLAAKNSDMTLDNQSMVSSSKALPPIGFDQAPTLPQIDVNLGQRYESSTPPVTYYSTSAAAPMYGAYTSNAATGATEAYSTFYTEDDTMSEMSAFSGTNRQTNAYHNVPQVPQVPLHYYTSSSFAASNGQLMQQASSSAGYAPSEDAFSSVSDSDRQSQFRVASPYMMNSRGYAAQQPVMPLPMRPVQFRTQSPYQQHMNDEESQKRY